MALFTKAPIWVWPLLAGLIFLGWRASRTRHARPGLLLALPLLGLLGLNSVSKFANGPLIWAAFALAYAAGAWVGHQRQGRWILGWEGGLLHLRGEWLTMGMVLALFCGNFALGALRGAAPELLQSAPLLAGLAALFGFASGSFAGRALKIWKTVS